MQDGNLLNPHFVSSTLKDNLHTVFIYPPFNPVKVKDDEEETEAQKSAVTGSRWSYVSAAFPLDASGMYTVPDV